jgi:hypothetical protein
VSKGRKNPHGKQKVSEERHGSQFEKRDIKLDDPYEIPAEILV